MFDPSEDSDPPLGDDIVDRVEAILIDAERSADDLFRRIGERWRLPEATRASAEGQQQLASAHRARMLVLWSAVRLWMEWQYAWDRWPEFHAS